MRGGCGYDGSHYIELEMSEQEFEDLHSPEGDGCLTPEQLERGTGTFL